MARSAVVLSPEVPYPLNGGGALRTASLVHYLAQRGPVDLIVFRHPHAGDPAEALPAGLVRKVTVVEVPHHSKGKAARLVRNARRVAQGIPPLVDRFAGFEDRVRAAIGSETYDIALIEHSWCAPYAPVLAQACKRVVLDLHNVESTLHDRCAAVERAPEAMAHRVFAEASRKLERRWLPEFSAVLVTSESDAAQVRALTPEARVLVFPNALPEVPEPAHTGEDVIAYSGNFEYHPNRQAVEFFRRDIWPRLLREFPQVRWRLIGKNPEAVARWTAGDPRIETTGPVDDAIRELGRCRVAVAPLLAASGTRLKILEAWAAGLPVVSTPVGAEGLPVEDGVQLLLAADGAAFAAAVARVLKSPELRADLGRAGRNLFVQEFTWEKAWKKLEL